MKFNTFSAGLIIKLTYKSIGNKIIEDQFTLLDDPVIEYNHFKLHLLNDDRLITIHPIECNLRFIKIKFESMIVNGVLNLCNDIEETCSGLEEQNPNKYYTIKHYERNEN